MSNLELLPLEALDEFKSTLIIDPSAANKPENNTALDYYQFHSALAAHHSIICEGFKNDFNQLVSYILNPEGKPSADIKNGYNLYKCYLHIRGKKLTQSIVNELHVILTDDSLPKVYQGTPRINPLFIVDSFDKIEYTACDVKKIEEELRKFYADVEFLKTIEMAPTQTVYMSIAVNLVFHKILPYHNFNMCIARLLEKWFLIDAFGEELIGLPIEENNQKNKPEFNRIRKKIGRDYYNLNYARSTEYFLYAASSYRATLTKA